MSSLYKMVTLCANVKIAEREDEVAMVKNAMLEIAVVSVAIKVAYVEAVAHEATGAKEALW